MSRESLITNSRADGNHLQVLARHIATADRICISTAFLRSSGLGLIIEALRRALRRGAMVEFYCGLCFYHTEPDALQELHSLCTRFPTAKVTLLGPAPVPMFHPKLCYFHEQERCYLLVGSANLTRGGLVDNCEISALVELRPSDGLARDVEELLRKIAKLPVARPATDLAISQYRAKYDKYHNRVDQVQAEAEEEASAPPEVDLVKAKGHLADYLRSDDGEGGFEARLSRYRTARAVLNDLCRSGLSRGEFASAFDRLTKNPEHLWASDPLYRSQSHILSDFRRFVNVVKLLRESRGMEAGGLFDAAMHVRANGMGANHVTEIMATYAPDKYAVLNSRPLAVLGHLGCESFPAAFSFAGERYAQYTTLLDNLREEFGFRWLLQVDHYFNWYYDSV